MTVTTTGLKNWTPDAVQHSDDPAVAFSEYAQQALGVPWPTVKDTVILRAKAKEFFDHYPDTDWRSLCRIVQWAANRKKRYSRAWLIVNDFRKAYSAGWLPELDPASRESKSAEENIFKALEDETDPVWRKRLMLAQGAVQQEGVYAAWRQERGM